MKNIIAAFSLFIIMIIGICISKNTINKTCEHLQYLNSSLENYILKEEWQKAYDLSLQYISEWEKDSKFLTLYIHHEDIDSINNESLKLTQYIKTTDKAEALATVHVMKYLINHILSHQKVTINNIF